MTDPVAQPSDPSRYLPHADPAIRVIAPWTAPWVNLGGIDHESAFVASGDGALLRCATWRRQGGARGLAVVLHGRTECIEKYMETIGELIARGFDVASMDWRGQGLSQRETPDPTRGHVDGYERYLADLDRFLVWLGRTAPRLGVGAPLYLLAHSMGGHIALRWLAERGNRTGAPPVAGAAFSAPMVDIHLPMARWPAEFLTRAARRLGLGKRSAFSFGGYETNPPEDRMALLTHDAKRYRAWAEAMAAHPELRIGGGSFSWLLATLRSIDALAAPGIPESIDTSLTICQAERDVVVSNQAMTALAARIPAARLEVIEGSAHEILMETDRVRARFWTLFDEMTA